MMITSFLQNLVNSISTAIELAAIAIISWGSLVVFLKILKNEALRLKGVKPYCKIPALRRRFGSYLLLGLEFLIAADIVLTIAHPSLTEIAILGSIVAIRTVIGYFLDKELEHLCDLPEDKE